MPVCLINAQAFSFMNLTRFPDFTSEELLRQFIGSVQKGKANGDFMALAERALQAEESTQDNGTSGVGDTSDSSSVGDTSDSSSVGYTSDCGGLHVYLKL